MLTLHELSERFEGVAWRGKDSFQCRCPAHDDQKASLTVSDGNKGLVLYCHAGCVTKDILQAVGLSFGDICPDRKKSGKKGYFDFKSIVAEYKYRNGTRKLRDANKEFIWQHKDPDGSWKSGRNNAAHVLYAAGTPQQTVYVVEGEKDADNLSQLGLYCVSAEDGAGKESKWYDEYTQELTGKDVVLIPDNDVAGRQFDKDIAVKIAHVTKSLKVVDLRKLWAELPNKGDISDMIVHYGTGRTADLLHDLEQAAVFWTSSDDSMDAVSFVPDDLSMQKFRLEYGGKNNDKVLPTINNFLQIMTHDAPYERIYFNQMTGRPEVHTDHGIRSWTDADEAESKLYIEQNYQMHNDRKHADALRIFFRKREYHPLLNLVESFEWDGINRCELFLNEVMRCDDNEYTREVSRLIFAGGINRLYSPGCKVDSVVVLIGPQGCGKSTVVNWLALNDDYAAITKNMSGDQKSIEALLGAWIVEVPELAAFKKSDIESLKAFVTCRFDKYRLPFDRNPSVLPRRCIFIGTGNNPRFLTDKSGNRRFFPVECHSNGNDFLIYEDAIRTYITQAWAEAKVRYKEGKMPPYPDPSLITEYQQAQENAMEDDWRVGLCEKHADQMEPGDLTCVKEIYRILYPNSLQEPQQKDSRQIGEILDNLFQLEKVGLQYTNQYGRQRCWKKR